MYAWKMLELDESISLYFCNTSLWPIESFKCGSQSERFSLIFSLIISSSDNWTRVFMHSCRFLFAIARVAIWPKFDFFATSSKIQDVDWGSMARTSRQTASVTADSDWFIQFRPMGCDESINNLLPRISMKTATQEGFANKHFSLAELLSVIQKKNQIYDN